MNTVRNISPCPSIKLARLLQSVKQFSGSGRSRCLRVRSFSCSLAQGPSCSTVLVSFKYCRASRVKPRLRSTEAGLGAPTPCTVGPPGRRRSSRRGHTAHPARRPPPSDTTTHWGPPKEDAAAAEEGAHGTPRLQPGLLQTDTAAAGPRRDGAPAEGTGRRTRHTAPGGLLHQTGPLPASPGKAANRPGLVEDTRTFRLPEFRGEKDSSPSGALRRPPVILDTSANLCAEAGLGLGH